MIKDERLLPLPTELKKVQSADFPTTYAPVYDADPFAEKRSIQQYLSVVLKRKWLILTLVAVVTISTAFYMYRLPTTYKSSATISIEPRQQKQVGQTVNINLGNDPSYRNTQLRMIQSKELMRDVVIANGLYRNPNLLEEPANIGLFGRINILLGGPKQDYVSAQMTLPVVTEDSLVTGRTQPFTAEEKARIEKYTEALNPGLSVVPEEGSYLVNLIFTHTIPTLTTTIPNAVASVYIAKDIEMETQSYKQAILDNIKQIEQLRSDVNRLENEKIAYLQQSNLPMTEGTQQLSASILGEYSEQLQEAQKDLSKARSAYEAAVTAKSRGNAYDVPEVNESATVRVAREKELERKADLEKRIEAYEKEISNLTVEREKLLVRFTPTNRQVVQIDAQIAQLITDKERTQKEVSRKIENDSKQLQQQSLNETLGNLRARYEAASKRESAANQKYLQELRKSNQQGQAEIKLNNLTTEIESTRKLLDTALQGQKNYETQANASRPNNIKVVNEAQQHVFTGPQRSRSILIAMLLALASGIGLAFLLDYLDDSIKSSDDIGRHLGLPTLALIPHNAIEGGNGRKRLGGNAAAASTALIALEDARSPVAEAYRHLRTSLLFSSAGKPPQTILITSSQPSEGKTTTAINTAIALAQAGAEVVIVDCDLRRPRLHNHFQLENMHGLTNYLSGERNTAKLLKECRGLANLKVITSGPIPPNPAEMLGSNEMRSLVDFLRTNFKHVIIDSPPAISFTDATILATLVDGVVIVAMAGKSSVHLIRRFKQRLNNIGARIYGVVLNGLKRNSLDYGYGYYGYGYNYNYTDEYGDDADDSTPRLEEVIENKKEEESSV